MRKVLFLLSITITLFFAGCGSDDEVLSISISPNKTFFLPGEVVFADGQSCYDEGASVSEPRFRADTLNTTWSSTDGSFQPVLLKITITASSNISEFTCAIAGATNSNLGTFLGYEGSTLALGSGETTVSKSSTCAIHCGGVSITTKGASFTSTAKVELIGIHVKSDGSQVPVKATTSLAIQNVL